jgi:hypothetical protein
MLAMALALLLTVAVACKRDDIPEDERYPGNDPRQRTDLTTEPMHNYADDAEEDQPEEDTTVDDVLTDEVPPDEMGDPPPDEMGMED